MKSIIIILLTIGAIKATPHYNTIGEFFGGYEISTTSFNHKSIIGARPQLGVSLNPINWFCDIPIDFSLTFSGGSDSCGKLFFENTYPWVGGFSGDLLRVREYFSSSYYNIGMYAKINVLPFAYMAVGGGVDFGNYSIKRMESLGGFYGQPGQYQYFFNDDALKASTTIPFTGFFYDIGIEFFFPQCPWASLGISVKNYSVASTGYKDSYTSIASITMNGFQARAQGIIAIRSTNEKWKLEKRLGDDFDQVCLEIQAKPSSLMEALRLKSKLDSDFDSLPHSKYHKKYAIYLTSLNQQMPNLIWMKYHKDSIQAVNDSIKSNQELALLETKRIQDSIQSYQDLIQRLIQDSIKAVQDSCLRVQEILQAHQDSVNEIILSICDLYQRKDYINSKLQEDKEIERRSGYHAANLRYQGTGAIIEIEKELPILLYKYHGLTKKTFERSLCSKMITPVFFREDQ